MTEETLTAAIDQYKEQFLQVQNILQATGEEGQDDMVKIRDDLVELIHLSEESLLSLKKTRLLQALEEQETNASNTPNFDNEAKNDIDSESRNNDCVEEEDIIGTKCRVAYTQEWGVKEHHNAMVFTVEMLHDNNPDDAKVRVLFLNPTHNSMVPCPYFLDGKCRYSEDECRYSHGFLVKVEDLKPFREPNFSEVEEGQQCLARYSDGVWYKSTIKSVDEDHHQFIVHYDTYNIDATLGLDSVFPIDKESPDLSDDDLSSLSSDSEESRLTSEYKDEEEEVIRDWKPTGMRLGDWEQHTRGIGSKLMAKMGYIFGNGLGRDGSGRVDPVEAVVLPQGKSLDVCAELREKKRLKEPFKKKRKKKKISTKIINLPKQRTVNDVFLFLNHKFGGSKGNIQDIRNSAASSSETEQFDVKDRKKRKAGELDGDVNWNIKLFKIHEEIAAAEKQLGKQKQAHRRHSSTESHTSLFFKKKVEGIEHQLQQLKAKEKMIKQKLYQKDQHKKLTTF